MILWFYENTDTCMDVRGSNGSTEWLGCVSVLGRGGSVKLGQRRWLNLLRLFHFFFILPIYPAGKVMKGHICHHRKRRIRRNMVVAGAFWSQLHWNEGQIKGKNLAKILMCFCVYVCAHAQSKLKKPHLGMIHPNIVWGNHFAPGS